MGTYAPDYQLRLKNRALTYTPFSTGDILQAHVCNTDDE